MISWILYPHQYRLSRSTRGYLTDLSRPNIQDMHADQVIDRFGANVEIASTAVGGLPVPSEVKLPYCYHRSVKRH